MTGIGLWILYSKIRWCRIWMHGTKIESWVKSFSSIDLEGKEADQIAKEIQKGEDLKNWRKLKIKENFNDVKIRPAISFEELGNSSDRDVSSLKNGGDSGVFVLVPYPSLKEPENKEEG